MVPKRRRNKRSKFIPKLYEILQDQTSGLYWRQDQNSFVLSDFTKIINICLPKYFKHSNISSFIRQLNLYGFKKLYGEEYPDNTYSHEKFTKNNFQDLKPVRSHYNKEKFKIKTQRQRSEESQNSGQEQDGIYKQQISHSYVQKLEQQIQFYKSENRQLRRENERLKAIQENYKQMVLQNQRDKYHSPYNPLNNHGMLHHTDSFIQGINSGINPYPRFNNYPDSLNFPYMPPM